MAVDVKWRGVSLTLSSIQSTPMPEWIQTITHTLSDRVKYEISETEIEAELTKIYNDVNGVKETREKPSKAAKTTSDNNQESGKE